MYPFCGEYLFAITNAENVKIVPQNCYDYAMEYANHFLSYVKHSVYFPNKKAADTDNYQLSTINCLFEGSAYCAAIRHDPPAYAVLWWAFTDSNCGPTGYEPVALTN